MNPKSTAKFLGWFSIVLGAGEVLLGGPLAKALGMEKRTWLIRLFGLREIAAGTGILAAPEFSGVGLDKLSPWLWARVGGDALDSAVLFSGLSDKNPKRRNVLIAILAVTPIILLDMWCAPTLAKKGE